MSWVVWRQHRVEGLWALITTVLLAAIVGFVAYELSRAACPPTTAGLAQGSVICLPGGTWGLLAQGVMNLDLYQYGLVVLPALAGAFIGAPLVAREIETGTARLAWTQGVTRTRWVLVKLVLVMTPLLGAAMLVGLLEVILINAQGPGANRWAWFDQQAPMTAGSTAFALALGVAFGSFLGRSIPAMGATLIGFGVVRIGLAEAARPHYMTPLVLRTSDSSAVSRLGGTQTSWWLTRFQSDASGVQSLFYQPADRFWAFQGIETAILVGLAVLLLTFSIYWVARRVS